MTCAKTQGFLAKHKVSVTEQTDAKKATIKGAAALGVNSNLTSSSPAFPKSWPPASVPA